MIEYERIYILEGIDINKINNQKNVCFVTIGISWVKTFVMDHIFVMVAII